MTVFHGTNADFDKVSLDFAKEKRDFGRGFYTTIIREQAVEWAKIICRRYKAEKAVSNLKIIGRCKWSV